MRILMTDPFLQSLNALPPQEKINALLVVSNLREAFKQPHAHSGIGLRKIGKHTWEVRVGLALRIVFSLNNDLAELRLLGHHDEVQRYLRSL